MSQEHSRGDEDLTTACDLPSPEYLARIQLLLGNMDLQVCLRNPAEYWTEHHIEESGESERIRKLYTYLRPEYAVAQAIATGESPEEALQQWQDAIRTMLSDYRQHRRQSLLIEVSSATRYLDGEQRENPVDRSGSPAQPTADSSKAHLTSLHLALASVFVQETQNVGRLLAELSASTVPLDGWDTPPHLSLTTLSADLQADQRAKEQLGQQVGKLHAETEALRTELAQVQVQCQALAEELDIATQERERLASASREQAERVNELQEQLAQGQGRLTEQQEENGLLLKQLHVVQGDLEKASLKIQAMERTYQQAKDQLRRQEQQIQAEQAEKTRFADENREQNRRIDALQETLCRTQSSLTEHQEENGLLLKQLHVVQEELEQVFLRGTDLEIDNDQPAKDPMPAEDPKTGIAHIKRRKWRIFRKRREKKALKQQITMLNNSALFDGDWYLKTYRDVAEAGMDPAVHYLKFGATEGRDPGPDFSTQGYLAEYPDVAEAGMNPLLHYLKYGMDEQRKPAPNRR